MTQTITGGAQNLNGGSTLASAPAQTATGLEIATMQNVKFAPNQCTAWVSFNGATGAIRAAYNVASVSKSATGTYTVNFTTPMDNVNYCVSGLTNPSNGSTLNQIAMFASAIGATVAPLVGSFRVFTTTGGASAWDFEYVMLQVFGGKTL